MGRNKISTIFCLSFISLILTAFPIAAQEPSRNELTDQQKQQEILDMVNSHRNALPSELVLAIIRLEGGEGAFHVDGQVYNSFYRQSDVPWAQPKNGDGIMQVTAASGYHKTFTHDRAGYDLAISSGCNYLSEFYNAYGTYVQTALHYNTGPNSLYIYLGKNQGDRNYLSHVAGYLSNFISNIYGLEDQNLADSLNRGQKILNDYLYNKGIATGRSIDYYKPYQVQLDNDLYNIEYSTQDNVPPTIDTNSKFKLGERIWTTTDVNVRADPGLTSAQINSMADGNSMIKGNTGTVLGGPISKDGYTWWKVDYDIGVTGWSAENYLELVPNGPQQPSNFAQWSEDAIEWGENNINSRDWWDSKEKIGYCLRFVANAFMQEKVKGQTGSESAIEAAQKNYRFNQEQKGWQYAPRGALIFFNAKSSNPYGHVGIYLGDGKNIINAYGAVQEISIESISVQKDVGYYIGWSYPPKEWHRDDNTLDDNVEINCQWCCEEGKMMVLRKSSTLPPLTSKQIAEIVSRCQQAGCIDSYNQASTTGTCGTTQKVQPNVPAGLNQFKLDGSSIPVKTQIADRSVAFKAMVSNIYGGKLRLQVELRRLDEYGGQFDDSKGGLKESDPVESGEEATAHAYGLINGYYHWRARAIDESGKASDWVDFGNDQGVDFIVFSKTETNTGNTFNKGDRVRTTSDKKLNVRSGPGTSSQSIGTMVKGSMGTIIDGPVFAGNLYWWKIEYDAGITGWSSGKWLELAPQITETDTKDAFLQSESALPTVSILSITFADDFSSDTGLWSYSGNAYRDAQNGYIVLTPNKELQVGNVWLNQDITSPFTVEFRYKAGGGTGADGLTLMFYKDKNYEPGRGGRLGFISESSEVAPGYGIEFDNYENSEYSDPNEKHIALIKDRVSNHLRSVGDQRTEDNQWHQVKVEVNARSIVVYVDGDQVINFEGDIDRNYGGLGFSAATWSYNNWHLIDDVRIST
jgi:uncharacterized protein YraI